MNRIRQGVRAALTAGALLSATLANTGAASESRDTKRIEHITSSALSENEIDFLTQNVYHEARGEPLEGQLAVAQVTLARLASGKFDRGNGLIDGVVFAPGQFSWTNDPKVLMSKMDNGRLANIRAVISLFTGGKPVREAVSALSEQTKLPQSTYFYKRTDWNENNLNETRMSPKTKELFRRLTPVGVIGNHTYYIYVPETLPRKSASLEKKMP